MKIKLEKLLSPRGLLFSLLVFSFLVSLLACSDQGVGFTSAESVTVQLSVDGISSTVNTEANSVRELLEQEGVVLSDSDLVDPPLFTPLTEDQEIVIVRVTESIEIIENSIPFQRRTVRNQAMSADEPPVIVQAGTSGLQETTIRIIYHDGAEFSRQETKVTVIKPAQDEIVMLGVGLAPGSVEFPGLLAFISGGNSVLMRGTSAVPVQVSTGNNLDRRVFSLSPDGSKLLFTRTATDTNRFNSLWVIGTEPNATPQDLGINNVLWADWNPAGATTPQIAFTTGTPTDLLPGWEANNDLWLADISISRGARIQPTRLIEAYPATYSWWGGNYIWSPLGRYIAYSYADEVGIIDTEATSDSERRQQLQSFTEFSTGADWVWVPSLSWSPDGEFLAFSRHMGDDPNSITFDTWVISVAGDVSKSFMAQTGIWSHPHWSPARLDSLLETDISEIAFLRATNPLESQLSSYTLWHMDRDGSNAQQLYPPAGENSRFPRDSEFMTWGPTGHHMVFVYDNQLYLYDTDARQAKQLTHSDLEVSNPTWAPYGLGRVEGLDAGEDSGEGLPASDPLRGNLPVE